MLFAFNCCGLRQEALNQSYDLLTLTIDHKWVAIIKVLGGGKGVQGACMNTM